MHMPYCVKCRREMGETDNFCANCGAPAPRAQAGDRFAAQHYDPGPNLPPAGRLRPALPLITAGVLMALAAVLLALAARGQMAQNVQPGDARPLPRAEAAASAGEAGEVSVLDPNTQ